MERWLRRVIVASLCLALVAGSCALAHTDLVRSDPVRRETLDRIRDGVRLAFNEPVEAE